MSKEADPRPMRLVPPAAPTSGKVAAITHVRLRTDKETLEVPVNQPVTLPAAFARVKLPAGYSWGDVAAAQAADATPLTPTAVSAAEAGAAAAEEAAKE